MRRGFTDRAFVWASALVIVTGATAMLASRYVHSAPAPVVSHPVVSNGGARQWVAFDPIGGRNLGSVQFLFKSIQIVNTSNVPNAYSVTYEPVHLNVCGGTLAAGGAALCGVQPSQHLAGGYFQVIAAQPVLMGGYTDVPVMRFAQTSQGGAFGADPSTGIIQYIPLVWQQGCPPRPGSGCPDGAASIGGMPMAPAARP